MTAEAIGSGLTVSSGDSRYAKPREFPVESTLYQAEGML